MRSEPGVNASINVSYQAWTDASRAERVNLLAEALLRVVNQLKESKISAEGKDHLRTIVERVRDEVTRGMLN